MYALNNHGAHNNPCTYMVSFKSLVAMLLYHIHVTLSTPCRSKETTGHYFIAYGKLYSVE